MKLLHRALSRRNKKHPARRDRNRRACHEALESRRLLATITVNNLDDNLVVDNQITLREAIEAANTNSSVDGSPAGDAAPAIDVIQFDPLLSGQITLVGSRLEITEDVNLIGPGLTTLTIGGDDSLQIFFLGGADTPINVSISGLTLKQARAAGSDGAAITASNANLTLTHSKIFDNIGDAVTSDGTLAVLDCEIVDNAAVGLRNDGSATITNSRISGNLGDGLFNNGTMTVSNSTISGNVGGTGVYSGQATSLTVTRSTIGGNQSSSEGAGITAFGDLAVYDSTISSNAGGGILVGLGNRATVTNSTISGNTGGPGIRISDGLVAPTQATLTHSTIVANGSGVSIGSFGAQARLYNTLVAGNGSDVLGTVDGNSAGNLIGDPSFAGGLTEGLNLIGNGIGGLLPLDQIINPTLADNGGSTLTHDLLPAGRAIDGGNNSFATTPGDDGIPGTGDTNEVLLANDQRGTTFPRIITDTVDIGAIERIGLLDIEPWLDPDELPLLGSEYDLTINVTNYGPEIATGLELEVNIINSTIQAERDSDGDFVADTGQWLVGVLNAGRTATLRLAMRLETEDSVATASVVSVDQRDLDLTNNEASVTIEPFAGVLLDFGDAPTAAQSGFAGDYPVTVAQDGARHKTVELIYLGSSVDTETNGQPDPFAGVEGGGGDDHHNTDDEDGVSGDFTRITSTKPTVSSYFVDVPTPSYLNAWIDFNQDGDWDDADERITHNRLVSQLSLFAIPFIIPEAAIPGVTAARFRLTHNEPVNPTPTGPANSGEVEDYMFAILEGSTKPSVKWVLKSDATLQITGSDYVYRSGDTVLFQAPVDNVGAIRVDGTELDDTLTLDFRGGDVVSPAGMIIDGMSGDNTLAIVGETPNLDLTDVGGVEASGFHTLDLSDAATNLVSMDSAAVARLSPDDGVLRAICGPDDRLILQDASAWRMGDPLIVGSEFLVTANNSNSGGSQQIESLNPRPWSNFVRSSDVTNNGEVSARDALLIINELARRAFSAATGQLHHPLDVAEWPSVYFDQNADNLVSALDALRMINEMARINNVFGEQQETAAVRLLGIDPVADDQSRGLDAEITERPLSLIPTKLVSTDARPSVSAVATDAIFAGGDELTERDTDARLTDELFAETEFLDSLVVA